MRQSFREVLETVKNNIISKFSLAYQSFKRYIDSPIKVVILTISLITIWMLSGVFSANNEQKVDKPASENGVFKIIQVEGVIKSQVLKLTGITEALKKVSLKAEVEGKITCILAKQGQQLKRGDKIISIDSKNTLENMEEAKAALKQKQILYKSTLRLFNNGLSSEAALNAAVAQLKQAESNYKSASIHYNNTTITAPFDGIIDTIRVNEGEYINANSNTSLGDFISIDPIEVIVNIPEKDISLAKEAQIANLDLSQHNKIYQGRVVFLSKISDPSTHTFRMEIEVDNPELYILSGETGSVSLPVKEYLAHKVPQSALVLSMEGSLSMKTIDAKNMVKSKSISIIDEDSDGVWVIGLEPKEKILVLGQAFANDGQYMDFVSE